MSGRARGYLIGALHRPAAWPARGYQGTFLVLLAWRRERGASREPREGTTITARFRRPARRITSPNSSTLPAEPGPRCFRSRLVRTRGRGAGRFRAAEDADFAAAPAPGGSAPPCHRSALKPAHSGRRLVVAPGGPLWG